MPIRLFTSGTHNNLKFDNSQIDEIFENTEKNDMEKIPFVLGHPKNDLPVVGWIKKTAIKLYNEGDKKSIGFEKKDADFSQASIEAIKELGRDKISVRIKNGAITHIGLVKNAAVEENNYQEFSESGDFCFSSESNLSFDEQQNIVDTVMAAINKKFNLKTKDKKMDKDFEKLQEENKKLQEKMQEQEKKQKEQLAETKFNSFKSEFSKKEYENKFDFAAVCRLAKILSTQDEVLEFEKDGEKVETNALAEFEKILKASVNARKTKNGSVLEFGQENKESAESYLASQYENLH